MKPWRPKLIASDIDGTLLNTARQITEGTKRAISQAASMGIPVCACSGRYFPGTRAIALEAGMNGLVIAGNGAEVRTLAGDSLFFAPLSPSACLAVAAFAKKNDLAYNVYADDCIISETNNSVMAYYAALNTSLEPALRCKMNLCQDAVWEIDKHQDRLLKIELLHIGDAVRPALRALLSEVPDMDFEGNFHSSVEVHAKGVSKGTGLARAAQYYGVSLTDTMAFGDAENDVPMLKMAGKGIAMGNAAQEALLCADEITQDNDHDGVAQMIFKKLQLEATEKNAAF